VYKKLLAGIPTACTGGGTNRSNLSRTTTPENSRPDVKSVITRGFNETSMSRRLHRANLQRKKDSGVESNKRNEYIKELAGGVEGSLTGPCPGEGVAEPPRAKRVFS